MKRSQLFAILILFAIAQNIGFPCIPVFLTTMELYEQSDLVVILTVEQFEVIKEQKFAVAKVQDIWKGVAPKTLKFPVYPPSCWSGEVQQGDQGLTFLQKHDDRFILTNGKHPYTYQGHVSFIGKDHTIYYEFSEYELMPEDKRAKLNANEIYNSQRKYRRLTFPDLKKQLANASHN